MTNVSASPVEAVSSRCRLRSRLSPPCSPQARHWCWSSADCAGVIEAVDGYPYFLQLWGAELWDATVPGGGRILTLSALNAIRDRIVGRLDRDFFEGRFAVLRPSEQDLLLAAANCAYPPLRVSELRDHTDKRVGYVNVLMGRLTEAGIVYSIGKGLYR